MSVNCKHPTMLNRIFDERANKLPQHLQPANNSEEMCGCVSSGQPNPDWNGFLCSRPKGHTGDHVAHGKLAQICYRWT